MVFILFAALNVSVWLIAGILFILTIVGLWEFYQLVRSENCHPQSYYGILAGALLYLDIVWIHFCRFSFSYDWLNILTIILPLPLLFLSFILELFRNQRTPLMNIAITILGILYIAIPFSLLNLMNGEDKIHYLGFPAVLTGYFIITWLYDTGAYLFGKRFGKHKLFERISPKKTWEGALAGAVVALLTALGLSYLIPEFPRIDWFVLSILVLVFGSFGDLIESMFKRSLDVKDSGNILPGHGGILDRFDTILISAPFVFLYLFLRNSI